MYTIRLTWENGNKEEKEFSDYNEMLWYLLDNREAGFLAWLDDKQMNEADIACDIELIA